MVGALTRFFKFRQLGRQIELATRQFFSFWELACYEELGSYIIRENIDGIAVEINIKSDDEGLHHEITILQPYELDKPDPETGNSKGQFLMFYATLDNGVYFSPTRKVVDIERGERILALLRKQIDELKLMANQNITEVLLNPCFEVRERFKEFWAFGFSVDVWREDYRVEIIAEPIAGEGDINFVGMMKIHKVSTRQVLLILGLDQVLRVGHVTARDLLHIHGILSAMEMRVRVAQ